MKYSRISLLLVILCLAAFSVPAAAAAGRWTHAGPGGGEIRALAVDPSDPLTLYAAASPGGLYTSRNGGSTWTWSVGLDIWTVAVDPAHPATVYAGGPEELLRSTDRGRTWTRLDPRLRPYTIEALAVAPSEPSLVLAANTAGGQPGVLASTDGGETWSPVFSNSLAIQSIVVDPSNPRTIYLTGWAGIFKSVDAGEAWTLVHAALPGLSVLTVDPRRPSRLYLLADRELYRSEDGGESWALVGRIPGLVITRALAVDPSSSATVWAAGEHGVFVSRDAGETWRPAGAGLPRNSLGINVLAIDPGNPDKIYAGTSGLGVARTWNAGRRWWLRPQHGLSAESIRMLALDPGDPGRIYVTLLPPGSGSFRSGDGGRTWEPFARNLGSGGLWDVAPDPRAPGTLWAANHAGVWVSFNDGETWRRRDGTEAFHLAVASTNVLASGRCGLRLGERNGAWRQVLPCAPPGPEEALLFVAQLLVDSGDPSLVYAVTIEGFTSRLLGSRDQGRTWKPLREGIYAVALGSDGALYVYDTGQALRRSTDGGRTWSVVHEGGPQIRDLAVDAGDSRILYASTAGAGVLRSLDGGVTWEEMSRGLARLGRAEVGFLLAHPEAAGLVYGVPDLGGLFQMSQP